MFTFNDLIKFDLEDYYSNYNLIENDNDYVFELPIVGLNKKDISITVENKYININTNRKKDENKKYFYNGIFYGEINKKIPIIDEYDLDKINAKYENGILSITINKKEEKKKKTIVVE